jgi:ParB-like chromosome segregation protein Spo0J
MEMLNLTKPAEDFLSFIAHPLANLFPMIEGNAFEELKRDIAAQGILEPIRLYQGMILDGRNRYAAAKACGHSFSVDDFVQWEGTLAEAEAWVISTNMHRRQLTTKQKQEVIEGMLRKYPTLSDREIARQIGVSNSTVGAARERLTNSPEVRRYEAFKREWAKFSDAECMTFIRDNLADVKYLVGEVEKSNSQNPMT